MLLGLIFREAAKSKRSITSWRAESKGVLATTTDNNRPIFVNTTPGMTASQFSTLSFQEKGQAYSFQNPNIVMVQQETHSDAVSYKSTEKAGFGFGRQGEKAAGLRGFILQKPEESLPRYVSPAPPSTASALSRSASSASASSSFYVPEPPRMPVPPRQLQLQAHKEDDRHSAAESDDESESRHEPPTFKSSRTAL